MRPKHCIMPSTWSLRKSTFHFHATHSHLQGDGDSFKSQSVYKGILSARYNVFTCMIHCLSFQFVPYPIGEFIKTAQKGPVHAGVKVCLTRPLDPLPWSPYPPSSSLPFSLKYFSFFFLLNHLIFSSFSKISPPISEFSSPSHACFLSNLMQEALLPGLFSLLKLCTDHDLAFVNASLDLAARESLQTLTAEYQKFYKFSGRV